MMTMMYDTARWMLWNLIWRRARHNNDQKSGNDSVALSLWLQHGQKTVTRAHAVCLTNRDCALTVLVSFLPAQWIYWRRWKWEILAVCWHRERAHCVQARRYADCNRCIRKLCFTADEPLCLNALFSTNVSQSPYALTTTWSWKKPASSSPIFKSVSSNSRCRYGHIHRLFTLPSRYVAAAFVVIEMVNATDLMEIAGASSMVQG